MRSARIVWASLLLGALAATPPGFAQQGPIKIGEINSYSGMAAFTAPYKNGLLLAEEELNEGHRHIALSAYITVTAGSARELEVACSDVEQQAGQARLDIRREFGTQDVAFTYTLPLCRGLS